MVLLKSILLLMTCQQIAQAMDTRFKQDAIDVVKGQILKKLGLNFAPKGSNQRKPTKQELEAYRIVRDEAERNINYGKEQECLHQTDKDFYAHSVISLDLIKRSVKQGFYRDPIQRRLVTIDVHSMTFNGSQLTNETVERAEIILTPRDVSSAPTAGAQVMTCSDTNISNGCSKSVDSKPIPRKGDIVLDVTDAIKGMTSSSEPTVNVGVSGIPQTRLPVSYPSKGPFILVWYLPKKRIPGNTHRSRRRRALDYQFCTARPQEKKCCLRELYIDFQKDLKWNWIHAPRGFKPNYCHGDCPLNWGYVNQTRHTSLMAVLHSLYPTTYRQPCCVALTYLPLVILYYPNGKPRIEQLNNMVVSSCTCLS